ncbi:MAG: hypothetical protein HGA54_01845 [Actinobacteria bacterium]|nr:hypothetical protein [Actinomycetota bacterium]
MTKNVEITGNVISTKELRNTAKKLQQAIRATLDVYTNEKLNLADIHNYYYIQKCLGERREKLLFGISRKECLDTENAFDFRIALNLSARDQMSLTEAICHQLFLTVRDPARWRICQNENCKNPFKRQRSFNSPDSDYQPKSDSKYCSDRCREAKKKRDQRSKTRRDNLTD